MIPKLYLFVHLGGGLGDDGVNRVMYYVFNQTECTLKMLTIYSNLSVREKEGLTCMCVWISLCVCVC